MYCSDTGLRLKVPKFRNYYCQKSSFPYRGRREGATDRGQDIRYCSSRWWIFVTVNPTQSNLDFAGTYCCAAAVLELLSQYSI